MGLWKIWYEIYQNGQKIGSGLYHRYYVRRGDAIRRANIQYNKSLERTDGITFKWCVSQTNPWANGAEPVMY